MNDFRTELISQPSTFPLNLKDKIFTIGSCFADEIGSRLVENKFPVSNNPFGTVYNPISIHELLLFGLNKSFPEKESYSQNNEIHFNYHFHSAFSSMNHDDLETKIQNSILEANSFFKNANRIIVTYGTAFAYKLKSNNQIVANCHKMPSGNFDKQLMTESEIVKSFEEFYSGLRAFNGAAKIILTVSPVRHLKDTLELNAVSKSILRLACHSITNQFADVEYFPAYEILLDDLRDYRFYKTDRLHPTEEAVDYIWGKFAKAYVDAPTQSFISNWQKIRADLVHKSFHSQSDAHQKFLKSLLRKLETFQSLVDVHAEITDVKSKIVNQQS